MASFGKWRELAPLAAAVVDEFHMLSLGDEIVGERDVGKFEHLIHEVAHAASLGILPFDAGTKNKIGMVLQNHPDEGVHEEERTWAIEWFCWQHFGLDELFVWEDLVCAADIQGCNEDEIRRLVTGTEDQISDVIYQAQLEAIEEIERLTGEVNYLR